MILRVFKYLSDAPARGADIEIVDFFGQPIVAELAATLRSSGYQISYTHCPTNTALTDVDVAQLGASGLPIRELPNNRPLKIEAGLVPQQDQVQYGLTLSHNIQAGTVICIGLPLLSERMLRIATQSRNGHLIHWLQGNEMGSRDWRALSRSERSRLQLADHVICASEELQARVKRAGRKGSTSVLPSWGPLSRIGVGERHNSWASQQGFSEDRFRVVYAGQLGPRNRSGDLSRTVKELLPDSRIEFVFAGEGEGYDDLRFDQTLANAEHVHFLGRQTGHTLSQALASADLLLAALDPTMKELALSPNVLAYLCAGRPILALAERGSVSSRLIEEAGAGQTISSADLLGKAIVQSLDELSVGVSKGRKGRQFAERFFSSDITVPCFISAAKLGSPDGSNLAHASPAP